MAEPVSTAAAATVAAPAAAAASPAASTAAPAAGGGTGSGAATAGTPGSGANSPAYGLKSQGSPMDSTATQPNPGLDTSAMQRTMGCHDGSSAIPKNTSPQNQGEMPDFADHWFNQSGQHGQIRLPQLEQPGNQPLRQPDSLSGETVREPSSIERAQSSGRPVETSDPTEPRPEQRATVSPEAQPAHPGTPEFSSAPETTQSEPTAADFAQMAEPSAPPKAAPRPTEPIPEDAATASEPNRVPEHSTSRQPSTDTAPDELPPMLGKEAEALTLGGISGFFGIFVEGLADFGDLIFETFTIHGDKPGAREDFNQSREEFRTFSEETGRRALDKDETFGALGMIAGGFGPEMVSPGSKVKAAGAVGAATAAAGAYAQKKIKQKLAQKTIKVAEFAVEKLAAYRKLAKAKKIWKKPVSNSQGSWFQKWVAKKDHEYVAQLKNGKTVQIDDLAEAADGKLVLVEIKYMKPATKLVESGHVKFGAEKVEHLERLVKFFKENRDTVSHIEITVSRQEAAQIYAELLSASPKLAAYVGTFIRFGLP